MTRNERSQTCDCPDRVVHGLHCCKLDRQDFMVRLMAQRSLQRSRRGLGLVLDLQTGQRDGHLRRVRPPFLQADKRSGSRCLLATSRNSEGLAQCLLQQRVVHGIAALLLGRQANRPIQPDHFAIEHVVLDDVLDELGVVRGGAQSARERHAGG